QARRRDVGPGDGAVGDGGHGFLQERAGAARRTGGDAGVRARRGTGPAGSGDPAGVGQGASSRRASPWPPPPQRARAARRALPEASWWAAWTARRAPEAPMGWPTAMPPPWGLTSSAGMPRRRAEAATTAP